MDLLILGLRYCPLAGFAIWSFFLSKEPHEDHRLVCVRWRFRAH